LRITRKPEKHIITCCSGGFIASGVSSVDKSPRPFKPDGLQPISTEGFGEVQTPIYNATTHVLNIGDAVFFRPAKSGEIAERFSEYNLIKGNNIVTVKTYRGIGKTFY